MGGEGGERKGRGRRETQGGRGGDDLCALINFP